VAAAHDLCDTVEAAIHDRLPGALVTIHLEPDDGRSRGPWREEQRRMGGREEGDR
jgi:divalent metal cation (Fe/Co/Zn/Cd) transporter